MAQSLNHSVDLTIQATFYQGLATYGNILIGDQAFEFYNQRNPEDYIQIPWKEIDHIAASVYCNRWISRFAVFIKGQDSYYSFSSRNNKKTLRAMKKYIPEEKLRRSVTLGYVMRQGLQRLLHLKQ